MSRKYIGNRVVVYPQYVDSTKTRSEGRRIGKNEAIPKPTVEEIVEASRALGLEPLVENSRYPKDWFSCDKRVVVLKKYSKQKLLRIIASKIKESRST